MSDPQILISVVLGFGTGYLSKAAFIRMSTIKRQMKPGTDGMYKVLDEMRDLFNAMEACQDDPKLLKRVLLDYMLLRIGKLQTKIIKTPAILKKASEEDFSKFDKKISTLLDFISKAIEKNK